jgi:hypothetical protein
MTRFQPPHGRNKDEEFCLLGHAQPECSNSFSVLDLSFALPVSSLLKIKIKFGYIILRSSQTAVLGLPDPDPFARGTHPDRDSDPDFGSGSFYHQEKKKKNFYFYCFFTFL